MLTRIPGLRGFALLNGADPPQGPESRPPRGGVGFYCVFLAILLRFIFSSFFQCLFRSIFGRFSTPTWLPKSTKINQKSMPRCLPMLTSFFDRSLNDFCSQLTTASKSIKIQFFYNLFLFSCGVPIASNILPNIDPKKH